MATAVQRKQHPVWEVYDRLRSARLSVKYYGCVLYDYERLNFWMEVILAASAPTSAIAGFAYWKLPGVGPEIWQCFGVIAAIVAVVKVPLGLPRKIKEYEGILTGYRALEFDLMEIKTNIAQRRKYDAPLKGDFKKALQKERVLVGRTPVTRDNDKLKKRCQAEVLNELPPEAFFVPEDEDD